MAAFHECLQQSQAFFLDRIDVYNLSMVLYLSLVQCHEGLLASLMGRSAGERSKSPCL